MSRPVHSNKKSWVGVFTNISQQLPYLHKCGNDDKGPKPQSFEPQDAPSWSRPGSSGKS